MFRKPELGDKDLFDRFFKNGHYMGSESCFANSYAWQDSYNIEFDVIDGFLCIKGCHNGKGYFLMPYGEGDKRAVIEKLSAMAKRAGQPFVLKQLSKENTLLLENMFPGRFEFLLNRNASDYIYKTENLISLSGKKLHAKRNHVNKFKKTYNYTLWALDSSNYKSALEFALGRLGEDSDDEKASLIKLYENFEALNLQGAVLKVDGEIAAVSLGELLNHDTAVIHVEKANTDFDGAYAAINQMFAQQSFADTLYINREEDMGIEGLRRAKMSYQPEIILEKFDALER